MIDILIVEDEPAIATLLSAVLKHAGMQTRVAINGIEANNAILQKIPDLVLLDWMLPETSGIELLKKWRRESATKDLPIIMLTAKSQDNDKVMGLDSGVDDYVTKPFSNQELLARIRALLRRKAPEVSQNEQIIGQIRINPEAKTVFYGENPIKLSTKEFKLLYYLICYPHKIHSRAHLLDKLWSDDLSVDERAIDTQIKRIRAAFSEYNKTLIETVRGEGYRLILEPN